MCTVPVVDTSEGGAQIRGSPSLPGGTRVALELDGAGFALPCIVRGDSEDSMRLQFELDDATVATFRPFLERLTLSRAA